VELSLSTVEQDKESYSLALTRSNIKVTAGGLQGMHHGLCTLLQLIWLYRGRPVPQLVIRDRPRFPARGVLLGKELKHCPSFVLI
jgi:N-acetyl-beta-hexosaminidase